MATSFPGQQTVRCAYPQHYFRIFGKSRISWRKSKLKLCSNAERIHRKCLWIFHSVTSPSIPLTDWFNSIVFHPANPATQVYWKPSFSIQTEWATKKLWSRHEQGRMKHFLASPRNDALMPCFRNAVLTNISFACRNLGCFCSTHSASTSRRQAEKCEFICELTSWC